MRIYTILEHPGVAPLLQNIFNTRCARSMNTHSDKRETFVYRQQDTNKV